jgi:hypothetical protein
MAIDAGAAAAQREAANTCLDQTVLMIEILDEVGLAGSAHQARQLYHSLLQATAPRSSGLDWGALRRRAASRRPDLRALYGPVLRVADGGLAESERPA